MGRVVGSARAFGSPPGPFHLEFCRIALSSFTRQALASDGFDGFLTFEDLRVRLADVPSHGGVYIVMREAEEPGQFLEHNPGGRFKQRDPTVAADVLRAKWIDDCEVVYIGKGDNIQRRLTSNTRPSGPGSPLGTGAGDTSGS
jgi:hypothetical protein